MSVKKQSTALDDLPSIRTEEIAFMVGVSVKTIVRWGKAGRLHIERVGPRALRVRPSELARFLAEDGKDYDAK